LGGRREAAHAEVQPGCREECVAARADVRDLAQSPSALSTWAADGCGAFDVARASANQVVRPQLHAMPIAIAAAHRANAILAGTLAIFAR